MYCRTSMFALISTLSLGACSTMEGYYPNAKITEIDGREYFVAARPSNGENVYLAGPNKFTGREAFVRDFTTPTANVSAIEQVTGCKVRQETINNQTAGLTVAAVKC